VKILHVFDHSIPLHSGYTFRSRSILEQQRKLGWETEHLTSPKHNMATDPSGAEEIIDGLHFFRTPPLKGKIWRLPVMNQLAAIPAIEKRLNEVIPKIKPDIIHAHSPALNGWAAINSARKFGIPVVYEIRAFWEDAAVDHGTTKEGSIRYRLTRAMETRVINKADAVTTICEGLRSDIISRGVSPEKITVIPNAVDIQKFSEISKKDVELEAKHSLSGKTVIGFIGSYYAYEGLPVLVEALGKLVTRRKDVVLLLVGGGPQEGHIKALVQSKNLSEHVRIIGRVPHDTVQRYYSLVDILAYPRLPMRLTELVTPLKPLEAMAQKKLLVASDVGGHRELIENGKTGFLFSAGNAGALADVLNSLIDKREAWGDVHTAGRSYVENVRNWKNSVERYEKIYLCLTGKET